MIRINSDYLNLSIGKLGFGFMRMPTAEGLGIDLDLLKKMVDRYLAEGFSYFDTSFVYPGSEEALREALVKRHPRDAFIIATKMPGFLVNSRDDINEKYRTSLERLGTDYLDFYLLHGLDLKTSKHLDNIGGWDFMRELKEKGLIGDFGFSFHDTADSLDEILSGHPDVGYAQIQINYLDWDNPEVQSRKMYEIVRRHDKPFTIMGPVKGGLLSGAGSVAEKVLREANPNVSAASWAIRFAASLEGLLTMLSGMSSMEQLEDNIQTIKDLKPLTEEEKATLRSVANQINSMPNIQCTDCRYCIDSCPQELNIPKLIVQYNEYLVYGQTRSIGYPFEQASEGGRLPSTCTACRACEDRCPQKIEISDIMRKTALAYE